MKRIRLAPRIVALLLILTMCLPPPVFALRGQQREATSQLAGMEEALKTKDPFSTLKEPFYRKSVEEILVSLSEIEPSQALALFTLLDHKAATQGLPQLSILERYLFVALFLLEDAALVDRLIQDSVFLSSSGKGRLQRAMSLSRTLKKKLNFSDIVRVVYYEAVDRQEDFAFSREEPIVGMAKILLLGPYKAGDPKIGQFLAPPLGVHRIASFLKAFGFQVKVFDLDLYGEKAYLDLIEANQYGIIGFSMLEPTLKNEIRMMFETELISPSSFIIAGGQGAAFNANFLIEETPAKAVVRGLGEFSTLDIALHVKNGRVTQEDLSGVDSIYYEDENGRSKQTPLLPGKGLSLEDLRLISLLWDPADTPYQDYWKFIRGLYSDEHLRVMRTERLTRTVRIYTETHCPLGCDFCSSTNQLGDAVASGIQKLHLLPPEDVIRLIKRVKRAHPDLGAIYFNDDNFFLSKERIYKISKLIRREKLNEELTFFALSRVDNVDPSILKAIYEAGFYMVIYGVESLSDHVLKDMEKKVRLIGGKSQAEVSYQAVVDSLNAGLAARMNLILFYPTVTLEDLKITIDASTELIRKGAIVDAFTYVEPYAGSSILRKGYEIVNEVVEFQTRSGPKMLQFPVKILPVDLRTRTVAEEALATKSRHLEHFKQLYEWNYGRLPAPVDALISFYAVYKAAQQFDKSGAFSTGPIEEAIGELMRKESTPATLLRDDPTNTYFEEGEQPEPSPGASLEERMPGWLKGLAVPEELEQWIYRAHEALLGSQPMAVLFDPGLVPGKDDTEREELLMEMEGYIRSLFALPEEVWFRIGLRSARADWEGEFRIIEVVRHPEAKPVPLPLGALPLVVTEALASPHLLFYTDPLFYADLMDLTLPKALADLTDLFA